MRRKWHSWSCLCSNVRLIRPFCKILRLPSSVPTWRSQFLCYLFTVLVMVSRSSSPPFVALILWRSSRAFLFYKRKKRIDYFLILWHWNMFSCFRFYRFVQILFGIIKRRAFYGRRFECWFVRSLFSFFFP